MSTEKMTVTKAMRAAVLAEIGREGGRKAALRMTPEQRKARAHKAAAAAAEVHRAKAAARKAKP